MESQAEESRVAEEAMPFFRRHRKTLLGGFTVLAVLGILLIGLPLLPYAQLYLLDAETGQRERHLHLLARIGPFGRELARRYSADRFGRHGEYGIRFVLQEEQLWTGMERAKLEAYFGAPDAVDGERDLWYTERENLLWQARQSTDSESLWKGQWFAWNMCMAGEYDQDGGLMRFYKTSWPGDVIVDGAMIRIPAGGPPPPPPELLEAAYGNVYRRITSLAEEDVRRRFGEPFTLKTMGWETLQIDPDSSETIRYKYMAQLEDKSFLFMNQKFRVQVNGQTELLGDEPGWPTRQRDLDRPHRDGTSFGEGPERNSPQGP